MNEEKKFEFLDHPADLRIRAFGQNLEELFSNAALGMMTFLYPKKVDIKANETKENIKLKAKDLKALLVDWLSELLYLSDTKDCCYNEFNFDKLTEDELEATTYGRRVKAKEDIKAVTHHGLEVKQTNNGWEATIIFDI